MNDKQKKILEWLKKLEQFVLNEKLPMRLIDSIREQQEQAATENPDFYKLYIDADNLLQSIGQKVQKETSQEITIDDDIITVDEVKKKITETVTRGHSENVASISNALYGSRAPIQECYRQINEIANNQKVLKKIGNGNYFFYLFQKIKQSYEKNISRNFNDFAESVCNNCNHMIENIRSICKSIDGYKLGFGEEEFYIKYNERKEGWDNQLRYNIVNADLGAHIIMDFAQEILERMQPIIQKFKKKRNFCIVLPFLILFIGIALVGGFSLANKYMEYKNTQTNIENAQTNNDSEDEIKIQSEKSTITIEVPDFSLDTSSQFLMTKDTIKPILVAVIVILVLYVFYALALIIIYQNKITSACGEYLQKEFALFEKENRMDFYGEFEQIVTEYEQYYLDVLNEIFEGTTLDCYTAKKQSEYDRLCEEWNNIQRM